MFIKQQNAQIYKSDEGFSVELYGRGGIKYHESNKIITISSEFIRHFSGIVIDLQSIQHWDPPCEEDIIDEKYRLVIVDNIRRALQFAGLTIDINYA